MGEAMKRLCTIGARGGSKGVPNKNIRSLNGKPLIAHTIEQAKQSGIFDAVAVSSDSDEILKVAQQWGADILVKRPPEMATDKSPKLPAVKHCVLETESRVGYTFDIIVDLDATSPLRTPQDICEAVQLLESRKVSNVITGAPARRSPYFNLVEVDGAGTARLCKTLDRAIVRRQDAPQCFDMNASIYVWWRPMLLDKDTIWNEDTLLYEMPEERSRDIDTELDFKIVEMLLAERK